MSTLYTPILTNDKILQDDKQRWRYFCIDTRHWEASTKLIHTFKPVWHETIFDVASRTSIPEKQGIYMFVLKPLNESIANFQHKYILYVGQTINLRQRFGTYFGYINSKKPSDQLKRIMTLVWQGKLQFHYFEATNLTSDELTDIEFDLIDTIVPPMNSRFRADIIKATVKFYAAR